MYNSHSTLAILHSGDTQPTLTNPQYIIKVLGESGTQWPSLLKFKSNVPERVAHQEQTFLQFMMARPFPNTVEPVN